MTSGRLKAMRTLTILALLAASTAAADAHGHHHKHHRGRIVFDTRPPVYAPIAAFLVLSH